MQSFKRLSCAILDSLILKQNNVIFHQSKLKHTYNRKPLKKFVPSTSYGNVDKSEESDFDTVENVSDLLENNEMKFKPDEFKSPQEDENLKNDYLPKGFDLKDFPKFKKVYGADNKNPIIK